MRRRITLKIHPASLVLFAAAFLFADSHLAMAAVLALALHEGAHILALVLCGLEGCRVEITPFGGMMDERTFENYPPWKQAAAAGAGVAISGLTAWVCWERAQNTLFIQRFVQANLSLTFLNLLPLWPLDGARIIAALAAYLGIGHEVRKALSFLSVAAGVGLVILGLYGVWKGVLNPTLLAAGPYLCYACRNEMVASRVRRFGNMERKLKAGEVLQVSLAACSEKHLRERFASRLARGAENSYQILAEVDPVSGSIRKWWTEHEMLDQLLSQDKN